MDTLIGCFPPDKEHEEMTDKTTDTTKNRRTFDPAFNAGGVALAGVVGAVMPDSVKK
ncbi:hypothetical protein [Klebsiella pneumoniae]|uniref:hypothetical protein n=1 Tax=Klebsiella pneumoniae TaxID=573 RepID=UPI003A802953